MVLKKIKNIIENETRDDRAKEKIQTPANRVSLMSLLGYIDTVNSLDLNEKKNIDTSSLPFDASLNQVIHWLGCNNEDSTPYVLQLKPIDIAYRKIDDTLKNVIIYVKSAEGAKRDIIEAIRNIVVMCLQEEGDLTDWQSEGAEAVLQYLYNANGNLEGNNDYYMFILKDKLDESEKANQNLSTTFLHQRIRCVIQEDCAKLSFVKIITIDDKNKLISPIELYTDEDDLCLLLNGPLKDAYSLLGGKLKAVFHKEQWQKLGKMIYLSGWIINTESFTCTGKDKTIEGQKLLSDSIENKDDYVKLYKFIIHIYDCLKADEKTEEESEEEVEDPLKHMRFFTQISDTTANSAIETISELDFAELFLDQNMDMDMKKYVTDGVRRNNDHCRKIIPTILKYFELHKALSEQQDLQAFIPKPEDFIVIILKALDFDDNEITLLTKIVQIRSKEKKTIKSGKNNDIINIGDIDSRMTFNEFALCNDNIPKNIIGEVIYIYCKQGSHPLTQLIELLKRMQNELFYVYKAPLDDLKAFAKTKEAFKGHYNDSNFYIQINNIKKVKEFDALMFKEAGQQITLTEAGKGLSFLEIYKLADKIHKHSSSSYDQKRCKYYIFLAQEFQKVLPFNEDLKKLDEEGIFSKFIQTYPCPTGPGLYSIDDICKMQHVKVMLQKAYIKICQLFLEKTEGEMRDIIASRCPAILDLKSRF